MSEATREWFFDEKPSVFLREHRMMYLMVNAIAKRSAQLHAGEKPQVPLSDEHRDYVKIATQEFLADKLVIQPRTTPKIEETASLIQAE